MTTQLTKLGVHFEQNNPLYGLMDSETGTFPETLLSQRILSSIIEIKVTDAEIEKVLATIMDMSHKIDTVFSLSVVCRFEDNGKLSVLDQLAGLKISVRQNAKIGDIHTKWLEQGPQEEMIGIVNHFLCCKQKAVPN